MISVPEEGSAVITRRGQPSARQTWKKYFEARVAVIAEWYGISREEVLDLVGEKMEQGNRGDSVFDAVKAELESRSTRIVERA